MTDDTSLTFGREKRLRQSAEFARLKTEGRRLAKGCLLANWIEAAGREGQTLRLGVVTSKSVGGAVVRAKARRLMREAFRLNQQRLKQPLTLVLVARQSIVGNGLAEVERDFLNLMQAARLLTDQ
jgi:ribonuclease P protein component